MPGPYKYREVQKRLMAHDSRFQFWSGRGKGSERIIYHPDIKGRPESIPVKHHGNNTELRKGVIGYHQPIQASKRRPLENSAVMCGLGTAIPATRYPRVRSPCPRSAS
jgi:hypothetical protein